MRYYGGKHYLKKHILPIILADRQPNQLYWEPFVGGANTFQDVANPRLGSDLNPYLIALLAAVRDGWIPPTELTEEEYRQIKANPDKYPMELVGFAGFNTYSAVWLGTFTNDYDSSHKKTRSEYTKNSLVKTSPLLFGADLLGGDYVEIGETIPNNSIIYCDPPYKSATYGYYGPRFDSDRFWQWVAGMSRHHQVFVSEYTAPQGWQCIWQKELNIHTNPRRNKKADTHRVEKLFKLTKSS